MIVVVPEVENKIFAKSQFSFSVSVIYLAEKLRV